MKVTKSQFDHYWERGWVAIEGVFTPAQADQAIREAMAMADRLIGPDASVALADRSPDGRERLPRKLVNVFGRNAYFRQMIFASAVPSLVRQLIGVPPLLMDDEIFFKPPRHGSAKPYHQDNHYFQGVPAGHVLNAWIAFDDSDAANGCLRYIEGSHLGPLLPIAPVPGREHDLTPDAKLLDLSREALAPIRKGGVVLHHGNALHCSGPNESDRWRRAYATFWVGGDVVMAEEFRKKAYFSRPELWVDLPAGAREGKTGG
ncbi:MAG: phytanoyl-CoA dioxygenase family protein [Planctomycetota bacterium]|nr:phytanoyl-CoA dioxygenase family protein [Planctomycetota bacterium]